MPEIISLLKKHEIKNAYFFGSVLTNKFNEDSDVDFLVTIQENLDPVRPVVIYGIQRMSLNTY